MYIHNTYIIMLLHIFGSPMRSCNESVFIIMAGSPGIGLYFMFIMYLASF